MANTASATKTTAAPEEAEDITIKAHKRKLDEAGLEIFAALNQAKIRKRTEADRKLPLWLSHPTEFPSTNLNESGANIDEFSDCIDPVIINNIKKELLFSKLFPVQRFVVPSLHSLFKASKFKRPNDICVSSPTGSGKTLAYVIPVVNYLKKSIENSLRAIVILPTSDLASQVHKVFNIVCRQSNLRCVFADVDTTKYERFLQKTTKAKLQELNCLNKDSFYSNSVPDDNEFKFVADILVCTPGTLSDLLKNTRWFSVKDVEILVVDEADRLMEYQKHGWLEALERAVYSETVTCGCELKKKQSRLEITESNLDTQISRFAFTNLNGCCLKSVWKTRHLHKILFSATLSSDPQRLMHMNLFQPRLFLATKPSIAVAKIRSSLGGDISTPIASPEPSRVNTRNEILTNSAIPEQLEEKMFIIEAKEKVFCIWYMLRELQYKRVLCFVNKIETCFKLSQFINLIDGVSCVGFSSVMNTDTRKKILSEYKSHKIDVIVCTDILARGMDIEDVDYVISYDMPTSENFYVHRVGRTARAGNKGTAITLVDTTQLVFFKRIVQLAHKKTNSMRLSDVVEELRIPKELRKNTTKMDNFDKTYENFQDKMRALAARQKRFIK